MNLIKCSLQLEYVSIFILQQKTVIEKTLEMKFQLRSEMWTNRN